MAHHTIADEIVESLVAAGVQRIYGVVGDSLNPITDAVRRNGKLEWVHVRNEEAGAFAAGAEAQLTGRLAVCAGSCGPGNLHLINGLYDAHRSMAPVLAIASHIPSSEIGTGYFQETHPERLFQECSHYCELISSPHQMPRTLQSAMQNAIAKQGVGVVVVPGDVAAQEMPATAYSHGVVAARPSVRPPDADVARLADLLNGAERVTIFCGSGSAGAHAELLALAERVKAPIGHAFRGKEWVEYDNPYDVGMTGMLGFRSCYKAMQNCDLLLLLGTDFPYDAFMPTHARIAQVDIRAERLGRRSRLDLGLWGDVRETIQALLPLLTPKEDRGHLDTALRDYRETRHKLNTYVEHVGTRRPIHPEYVTAVLDELASEDAIFTVDTGMPCTWAARYIRGTRDRRILGSFNHGSMANALSQAIGAQLTYPQRQVISMSGDGGFAMLLGEFLTLLQYDLPVKVLVYNNGALDMVKLEMEAAGYPDWGTDLKNPSFAKMAEAMGVLGIRVEDPTDVRGAFQQALAHRGPALVDVVTDPNVLSVPPHITGQQVEGFALSMSKLILSDHLDEVLDTVKANIRNI